MACSELKYDKRSDLAKLIGSGKERLRKKILALDVRSIGLSAYNQRYLLEKIHSIDFVLHVYGEILEYVLRDQSSLLERFTLVDYGGGSGLLSLLAKEIGIKSVIYDDIYDVSCADIALLSHELGLALDHIICGDSDVMISYLASRSLSADAVASYDVLEHIYDVEGHFRRLRNLPGRRIRIVYASSANIENPWIVRGLKKKQIEAESRSRASKWGAKERDSLEAYLELRKKTIREYSRELAAGQVETLALQTRGLIKADIEKCVDDFLAHGTMSYAPNHPTNTCDPYTGNWCEHLMSFQWLETIGRSNGFDFEVFPGSYSASGSPLKQTIKAALNVAIRLFRRRGMFLAPYYVLCADRRGGLGEPTNLTCDH